jgi:hypothetical protein
MHTAPPDGCNWVSLIIRVFYLVKADSIFRNITGREISLFSDYVSKPVFCTKQWTCNIICKK